MPEQTPEQMKILREAQFSPNILKYTFAYTVLLMVITVVGIPFLLFVSLLFWRWWAPQFDEFHSFKLTNKGLEVRRGVVFRSETLIPLDRITDITISEDPLMRFYGVKKLTVETAGQTHVTGTGNLVGIAEPEEFKAAVLAERDRGKPKAPEQEMQSAGAGELLSEIRDVLKRIERQGAKKA